MFGKMKLLIHTATGKTALIAFLIHFAIICGWCLDGARLSGQVGSVGSQEYQITTRTIESSNCSSNETIHPLVAQLEESSAGSAPLPLLRKRSASVDYNDRLAQTATLIRMRGTDTFSVIQSAIPVSSVMSTAAALTSEPAVKRISLGLLLPHTTFKVREYSKAVQTAMVSLRKQDLSFLNTYRFQVSDIHTDMLKVNPSPTGRFDIVSILSMLVLVKHSVSRRRW